VSGVRHNCGTRKERGHVVIIGKVRGKKLDFAVGGLDKGSGVFRNKKRKERIKGEMRQCGICGSRTESGESTRKVENAWNGGADVLEGELKHLPRKGLMEGSRTEQLISGKTDKEKELLNNNNVYYRNPG